MKVYFNTYAGNIDKDILLKIPKITIVNCINEVIVDKEYGDGIIEYFFLLNIFSMEERNSPYFIIKEEFLYKKKNKRVYISPFLKEFDRFMTDYNNKEYLLKECCGLFLEGINKLKELKIKNFDTEIFYNDIEKLFIEKGWL